MDYAAAFVIGLLGSTVSAISTGGALITIPGLILLGFSPTTAIASSRLSAVTGGASTIYKYHKSKLVLWKILPPLLAISIAGGIVGPRLLLTIDNGAVEPIVGGILLLMLPLLFINKKFGITENEPHPRAKTVGYLVLFLIMVFSAMFGVGGGTFLLYSLIYFFGMKFTQANAAAQAMWLFGAASAFIAYVSKGTIEYKIALPMAVGSIIGGYVGAHIAVRSDPLWIKYLLALMIIASSIKLVFFK